MILTVLALVIGSSGEAFQSFWPRNKTAQVLLSDDSGEWLTGEYRVCSQGKSGNLFCAPGLWDGEGSPPDPDTIFEDIRKTYERSNPIPSLAELETRVRVDAQKRDVQQFSKDQALFDEKETDLFLKAIAPLKFHAIDVRFWGVPIPERLYPEHTIQWQCQRLEMKLVCKALN